jgi:hypothetical protein
VASYSDLKRRAFSKRRKAIKAGIPRPFLSLAEHHLNKAIFFRSETGSNYDRALDELNIAIEVFDAQINQRFCRYNNPLLKSEIQT